MADKVLLHPSGGPGSAGNVLENVGAVMLMDEEEATSLRFATVDSSLFSGENLTTATVTRWASGIGAGFLMGSVAYNGWAALDLKPYPIESTGGHLAVCYTPPYAIAFLPILIGAIVAVVWSLQMLISGLWIGNQRWEESYGGLAPVIVAPEPIKPMKGSVLEWVDVGGDTHLRLVDSGTGEPHLGKDDVEKFAGHDHVNSEPSKSDTPEQKSG